MSDSHTMGDVRQFYFESEKHYYLLDHIVEMKKLNHSILVNYMELLDIMIEAPASADVSITQGWEYTV